MNLNSSKRGGVRSQSISITSTVRVRDVREHLRKSWRFQRRVSAHCQGGKPRIFEKFEGASEVLKKKIQNHVAGIQSCTNLSVPQRKTRAEKRKSERQKRLTFPEIQKRSFRKQKRRLRSENQATLLESRRLNCALRAKVRRLLWFKQEQSIWLA
ncbi:MAG: hypothetical protein JNM65_16975 [Verrucomicrobiaceae bacterium]|nr:hypothetical protein [Verrucomicrobiaceae bacterium]